MSVGDNIISNLVPYEPLTERETDILSLIAGGSSNRKIADTLFIAHSTVRWYIRQIYSKLGAEDRDHAIVLAGQLGIQSHNESTLARTINNLPTQLNEFVGREQELRDLLTYIHDPAIRLISIVAPGGMGKTRLALALAEYIGADMLHLNEEDEQLFHDGIYFIDLTSIYQTGLIMPTIAEGLGYQFQQDGQDLRQQLLQYIQHKSLLLILDNFEHLLDSAMIISEMLEVAPNLQIVVTSRQRLQLTFETVYNIYGMTFQDDKITDAFLESDVALLFLQSARRIKHDFRFEPHQTYHLWRICELLDGMPLAVILAASWVDTLSLDRIADEIVRSIDFLSSTMRDLPERQYSIHAVFQNAWERLSESEQKTLMKLSVFRGGYTIKAGETIAQAYPAVLQSLISKSLIWHNKDNRYQMHNLLQQFAERQLASTGDIEPTQQAHCIYFGEKLSLLKAQLRSRGQLSALNNIAQDIENIRAGWYYIIKQESLTLIEDYLKSLYYFYSMRSRINEGIELFNVAITTLTQTKLTRDKKLLLGRILSRQGSLVNRLGYYEQAKQLLNSALNVLQKADAKEEVAFILNNLADAYCPTGDYQKAIQLVQQSLAIFEELEDDLSIAGTLNNLAVGFYRIEDLTRAEATCKRSLMLSKRLDDQHGVATSLVNLGAFAHDLGKFDEAKSYYQQSLDICERLYDRHGIAAALTNLGRTSYMLGAYEEGKAYCEEALTLFRNLGDLGGATAGLINLGDIVLQLGDLQQARQHFRNAMQTAQSIQAYPLIIDVLVSMLELLIVEEKYNKAWELLNSIPHTSFKDIELRNRVDTINETLKKKLPMARNTTRQELLELPSIDTIVEAFFAS